MSSRPPSDAPPRLIEEAGGSGGLLRAAHEEYAEDLDEQRAFGRLERRRQGRKHRSQRWLVAAGSAAAVAAGLVLFSEGASRGTPEAALVTAEPLPGLEKRARPPGVPEPKFELSPSIESSSLEGPAETALQRKEQPALVLPKTRASPPPDVPCTQLPSSASTPEARVTCLRHLAEGSGLSAEAALYELAHWTALHEGQRDQTLILLQQHAQRFPKSALRGEVDDLRVRMLYELGRDREALQASEAILLTPYGRVLSSKLHLLRGIIFEERLRDPARAVTEYVALIGDAGPEADEAEFRRAMCLERLGRTEEAVKAYARYLDRPTPKRAVVARARLIALRGTSDEGPSASEPGEVTAVPKPAPAELESGADVSR